MPLYILHLLGSSSGQIFSLKYGIQDLKEIKKQAFLQLLKVNFKNRSHSVVRVYFAKHMWNK